MFQESLAGDAKWWKMIVFSMQRVKILFGTILLSFRAVRLQRYKSIRGA